MRISEIYCQQTSLLNTWRLGKGGLINHFKINSQYFNLRIFVYETCANHKINQTYTSTEQLYDHNTFRHIGVHTRKDILPQAECIFVEVNAVDKKNW